MFIIYILNMDAIILSGGFAKRLLPISEFIPKSLFPLGGKPILDHIIQKLNAIGIRKIYISTNKKFSDQFEYFISLRKNLDISMIVEPTMAEEEKFGAIRGLAYALKQVNADSYAVIAGDNYFDFDLLPLKKFFEDKGKNVLALYDIGSIEEAKKYGVVNIDDEFRIKNFKEKPKNPESTLISTGIYMFNNKIQILIEKYLEEKNNPDQMGHLIEWLIKDDVVYGIPFKGRWYDIGTLEIYRYIFNNFSK
ncbi:MAG: nucleotidyltransferase family protein [Thermoplasmata archaeon]